MLSAAQESSDESARSDTVSISSPTIAFHVRAPPPAKRRKLDIPARVAKAQKHATMLQELESAYSAICKTNVSKRQEWEGDGVYSLQARRARAIESHLRLVVKEKMSYAEASRISAQAHNFAANWGARLVRKWVRIWIADRELPSSSRGFHAKVWSFLQDPTIREHIRAYLRSNKWSMNPGKLQAYLKNEMLPEQAKQYTKRAVDHEMPMGLKKYIELELLPRSEAHNQRQNSS
jgi:hypothetical protein